MVVLPRQCGLKHKLKMSFQTEGTPSFLMGVHPAHPRSGYPLRPGQVPGLDRGGGGGSSPNQNSIACISYAAGGMPLAFTQEDLLVNIFLCFVLQTGTSVFLMSAQYARILTAKYRESLVPRHQNLCRGTENPFDTEIKTDTF